MSRLDPSKKKNNAAVADDYYSSSDSESDYDDDYDPGMSMGKGYSPSGAKVEDVPPYTTPVNDQGSMSLVPINPMAPENQHTAKVHIHFGGALGGEELAGANAVEIVLDKEGIKRAFTSDKLRHWDGKTLRDVDLQKVIITRIKLLGFKNPYPFPVYVKARNDKLNKVWAKGVGWVMFVMQPNESSTKKQNLYTVDMCGLNDEHISKYGHVDITRERNAITSIPDRDTVLVPPGNQAINVMRNNPRKFPIDWNDPSIQVEGYYKLPGSKVYEALDSLENQVIRQIPRDNLEELAFSGCRHGGLLFGDIKGSECETRDKSRDPAWQRACAHNAQGYIALAVSIASPRVGSE